MKIIVFKHVAYRLNEKQYEPIQALHNRYLNSRGEDEDQVFEELYDHLETERKNYRLIGFVENIFNNF